MCSSSNGFAAKEIAFRTYSTDYGQGYDAGVAGGHQDSLVVNPARGRATDAVGLVVQAAFHTMLLALLVKVPQGAAGTKIFAREEEKRHTWKTGR